MKKKPKNTIDSWGIYGVKTIHIAVSECEADGQTLYNPQLTIILDDWSDDSEEFDPETTKAITIVLDSVYEDPKEALYNTLRGGILESFELVSSVAMIFDSEMKPIAEYDFNTDFEDLKEEYDAEEEAADYNEVAAAMREIRKGKVTIH